MRTLRPHVATPWFFCLLLLPVLLAAGQQRGPGASYDGHWWLSAGGDERFGFLNGFFDCYTHEFEGPDRYTSLATTYRTAITEFYQNGSAAERDLPVSNPLHRLRDTSPPVAIDRYGGHSKEPHGRHDGLYWREISARGGPELEQRGFAEGYLACHAELNLGRGGTFSKPASVYVSSITGWYGFNAETGDLDRKREPTPIADVLFTFKDQAGSAK